MVVEKLYEVINATQIIKENTQDSKKKVHKRSRRKTNNDNEINRIKRWTQNVEEWKKIINQDRQVQEKSYKYEKKKKKRKDNISRQGTMSGSETK